MLKKDTLQRFIFENAPIRGELIHLGESYQTIGDQHAYPPAIKRLLGEALVIASLLSAIIKFDGRLTVQFRGNGKLKMLLAQCDNQFHLRGLVKWDGEMTYEELMQSFNDGVLVINLDSGLKSRYQGIVAWRGNSLAESIEAYFQESEQLATKVWLSIDNHVAAGLLLQIIPGQDNQYGNLERAMQDPDWERVITLTNTIKDQELLYEQDESLFKKLYAEDEIRVFSPIKVSFQCTCSRKRGEDAILMLGEKEAEEELKDKNSLVVTCEFCNKQYLFDRVDVAKIFADEKGRNIHPLH